MELYDRIRGNNRVLPDALVIGTPAGGTSSLSEYLNSHPMYWGAFTKEVHFFDRPSNWARGVFWYRTFFPLKIQKFYWLTIRKMKFVAGEASPSYLANPYAAHRAFSTVPAAKIIALLRNPVERAYSYYHFRLRKNREKCLSFERAIETEERRLNSDCKAIIGSRFEFGLDYVVNPPYYPYLATGIYANHLKVWLDLYTRDHLLVIKSEDLFSNPFTHYSRILEFLELPRLDLGEYTRINTNTDKQPIEFEIKRRLQLLFKPHNYRLYEILGVDMGWDE